MTPQTTGILIAYPPKSKLRRRQSIGQLQFTGEHNTDGLTASSLTYSRGGGAMSCHCEDFSSDSPSDCVFRTERRNQASCAPRAPTHPKPRFLGKLPLSHPLPLG